MDLQQTPVSSRVLKENPFGHLPDAPSRNRSRIDEAMTQRVYDNLEILSVPPIHATCDIHGRRLDVENPLFNAALNRMRQGDALRKLRRQQEEGGGSEQTDMKGPITPILSLGRGLPERRRSTARSA